MWFPVVEGCMAGGALIIAIGAQNAYVLKMGIGRHYPFTIALFCTLIDSALIFLGVGGLGEVIHTSPLFLQIAKWGGIGFLTYYGLRSFKSALSSSSMVQENNVERPPLLAVVLSLLAVTLLNPHVYLDTVVLLGSIASQLEESERFLFAFGACIASFIWFFSLSYGAALLAPLFKKTITWRILDILVGCMMLFIAITLIKTG